MEGKKIQLKNGFAILKPFIDRKTMREYRKAAMVNGTYENVVDQHGAVVSDQGIPKKRFVADPAQMDACNDILVAGMVDQLISKDGEVLKMDGTKTIDLIPSVDFDLILVEILAMMNEKEEEKKN